MSQNFSLCLPCIYCLNPRRIKQYSNVFVLKRPLKNAIFVWKMGFARFVFSTTVNHYFDRYVCPSICSSVRPSVHHKIFFLLKSPWDHPLTTGVDPQVDSRGSAGRVYRGQAFARKCPRSRHFLVITKSLLTLILYHPQRKFSQLNFRLLHTKIFFM